MLILLSAGGSVVTCGVGEAPAGRSDLRGGVGHMEEWNLSEGRGVENISWGGGGWHVSGCEQYNVDGPVQLNVTLPQGREIDGYFAMVRVVRGREVVESVSLSTLPRTAEEAYVAARRLLSGLRVRDTHLQKLQAWKKAGPKAGPGEQLVIYVDESTDPSVLAVDVDWVASDQVAGKWIVTVSFFWDESLGERGLRLPCDDSGA